VSESNGKMTKAERNELVSLAKKRERVARGMAVHRTTQLRADLEKQLDMKYRPEDDPVWEELYKNAELRWKPSKLWHLIVRPKASGQSARLESV
jgi:hypothetical protein